MSAERAIAERPWSPADLLSVSEAAARVPMRSADAVELVETVARRVAGRRLVIWGDVLDLIRSGGPPPEPAAKPTTLRRGGLRR